MSEPYVIWRPQYDGHAPDNWDGGSVSFTWDGEKMWFDCTAPTWTPRYSYRYAPTCSQNADDAAFDVAAWLEQGRANLDKLPEGVVLPEAKDWADELAADAWAYSCHSEGALAAFLRAHCQPREQGQ